MTDLQIAKGVSLKHISVIAEKFGIDPENIEMFGKYKAKLPLTAINREKAQESNLILVSAISPTPAGEGKTTMSIGLSEGLNRLGKKTTVVLREPS
ncbi:MAG: formate--tetrahydrofolate ligase, partial [Bacteroidota bacterium]|nr:formate--tetrahydrofolate ligase [Bacteroidota bacterium]